MLDQYGEEHAIVRADIAVGAREYFLASGQAPAETHQQLINGSGSRSLLTHGLKSLDHVAEAAACSGAIFVRM